MLYVGLCIVYYGRVAVQMKSEPKNIAVIQK